MFKDYKDYEVYETVIDASGLHFWIYDMHHDRAFQSHISQQDLGVPAVMENYPQSWLDMNLLVPEDGGPYLEIHRKLKAGVPSIVSEHRIWPPYADSPQWERIIYRTIFDESGKPLRAVGIANDITAQKQMEENYRKFLDYMDRIVKTKLDAFKFNITKDTVVSLNDGMAVFGKDKQRLSMGDFFAQSLCHIKDPENRRLYQNRFNREAMLRLYARGERRQSMCCDYVLADGTNKWIKIIYLYTRNPMTKDIIAISYTEDLTECHWEQQLMQSIVQQYFDLVMGIDGQTGRFKVLRHSKKAQALPSLEGDDFDEENRRYGETYIADPAERQRCLRELRLSHVMTVLDQEGRFSYTYESLEQGRLHRKRLDAYYLDAVEKKICLSRIDVT